MEQEYAKTSISNSGDITPDTNLSKWTVHLNNINEVLHGFIEQNKPPVMIGNATLTKSEYNVLMVSLDHMYEHLSDLRGDFDGDDNNEIINIKRMADVRSLQKLFKK